MDLVDVIKQLDNLASKVNKLSEDTSKLQGGDGLTRLLCRWVIFPLIIIVAALTGINLALPAVG